MNENKFHKWFREKAKGFEEQPPEDVWGGIGDALESDIEQAYREKSSDFEEAPPASVWAGIVAELNKTAVIKKYIYRAAAALVLLAFAGGTGYLLQNKEAAQSLSSKPLPDAEVRNNMPGHIVTPAPSTDDREAGIVPAETEAVASSSAPDIAEAKRFISESAFADAGDPENLAFGQKNGLAEPAKKELTALPLHPLASLDQTEEVQAGQKKELQPEDMDKHLLPTGLYGGVSLAVNNTWMLNHDTYQGLQKENINQTITTILPSFSAVAGYNIDDNSAAEAEISFSQKGQKYAAYENGEQVKSMKGLHYLQMNLIYKRKGSRLGFKGKRAVSVNLLAGGYSGFLLSAREVAKGNVLPVNEQYKNWDFGLLLGLEQEIYISEEWMISASVRGSTSLNNIYAGTEKIPAHFNRTSNTTLGVNFGLRRFF